MGALVVVDGVGELTLERVRDMLVHEAVLLDQACSANDFKECKDRNQIMQDLFRRRKVGQELVDAAGIHYVKASQGLARMYKEESSTQGVNLRKNQVSATVPILGKESAAEAVEVSSREMRRLRPLAEATQEQLEQAINHCRATGQGVTPTSVVRALTATSAQNDYDGDEWYTPEHIINVVRQVLGEIDLDPASNPHAQKTVKAGSFYTQEDDGLSKQWCGRVFCNPPYSMPLIAQFTDKLIEEHEAGRTTEAIYLVNNCTDSAWFHLLLAKFPVCFTRGRIGFENKSGQKFATRQGQAIFYLGDNVKAFRKSFNTLGRVVSV